MPTEPRGVRNKNYLNVKNNPENPWQGSIGTDDKGHAIFADPVYGIRAAIITLRTYWFRYNKRTISEIIARWAPTADSNYPEIYSEFVSQRTGIGVNEELDLFDNNQQIKDKEQLKKVIHGMAAYENYKEFTFDGQIFDKAIQLI